MYHRRRFPTEIISHCVWLYFRFCLSYRDVEEIMAERGVAVTYETIRDWSQKFGGTYAKRLRSRTPRPGARANGLLACDELSCARFSART